MRRATTYLLATSWAGALALTGCSSGSGEEPGTPAATGSSPTASQSTEPPAEVMLGKNRYVDACHLVTEAALDKIVGPLPKASTITQSYVDAPTTSTSETSVCSYYFGDHSGTEFNVTAVQYADPRIARKEWSRGLKIADGSLQRQVENLPDGPLRDSLLAKLSKLSGSTRIKGLDDDILWNGETGSYEKVLGNALVRVQYKRLFGHPMPFGSTITPARTAMAVATQSYADPKLGQGSVGPARTDTTSYGDTEILDPCVLLSGATFKEATGASPDPVASYTTTIRDLSLVKRYSTGTVIVPRNECDRTGQHGKTRYDADVTIDYAKDQNQMFDTFLADKNDTDVALVPLETQAEETYAGTDTSYGDAQAKLFAHQGNYVITISYDVSPGGQSDAVDKALVTLTNGIVAAIAQASE
jgi:hypothetical protein